MITLWTTLCLLISVSSFPVPSKQMLDYQNRELGVIIHFNMATSAGIQGCQPAQVPSNSLFDPKKLDTDQWVRSIEDLGATYAIYVAKHGCGFATWPTKANFPSFNFTYDYGVQNGPMKTDVVRSFVNSCYQANIATGIYYSLVSNSWLNVHNGYVRKVPPNHLQRLVTQEQYEKIALFQLGEMWGNYGELSEMWFDGGYQKEMVTRLQKKLKLQPDAVAFNGLGVSKNPVRWIGNENGQAPDPNWSTEKRDSTDWLPSECDYTLQNSDTWFYNPKIGLRSLETLKNTYHVSVGRNCNLLLDIAPTPEGIIPPDAVKRYKEFGDWIRSCYGTPVASVRGVSGYNATLSVPKGSKFDRVVLMENQFRGQLIGSFSVSVKGKEVFSGQSVGHKRIILLKNAVTATEEVIVSVVTTSAYLTPIFYQIAVYGPGC